MRDRSGALDRPGHLSGAGGFRPPAWPGLARDRRRGYGSGDADSQPDGRPYRHAVRIVAFNTAEGWPREVTKDIADELRRRLIEYGDVPRSVQAFVEAAGR